MTLSDLNIILSKLAQNPGREHVLEFAFALTEWMGLKPNADKKPQLLAPQTQKLKEYLAPVPQTVQPQLYRLTADGQSIRVRFATLKKLKKDYIGQLVDNDPGLTSYQASSKGIVNIPGRPTYIPSEPYFVHFITTPAYDRLTLVFNQGDQKRIITFRNRLTHTQYNKIIEQWHGIAAKAKPELADLLWRSLDIKEVNKEFYKEIKERFDALVGIAIADKTKATESQIKQFAVRLIGRYIFCWFLKEKGVIPEALLSRKTIVATKDYYKNILLTLFFETLNTKVLDREILPENFQKIPYLNGGLFDENEEDKLFKKLDADEWLAPFVKVLEDYDFTVDESSSNYQHVAVDPEMLGRIFENLLASQNEETEKLANQRKAYGAFYTPREIVDYMVNESLKAYLQTSWEEHIIVEKTKLLNNPEPAADIFGNKKPQQLAIETKKYAIKAEEQQRMEKALTALFSAQPNADGLKKEDKNLLLSLLSQIKILDPACGSGAFPMGVLQKLMELHEALGTVKSSYELKKDILSQNIYGVDIMPMAIEIARLRAWLSLVLEEDYKPADAKHNFGVKPLPNLDFKFVCANSLIDLGLDAFIQESKGTLHEGFTQKLVARLKELEEMRKHYFLPDVEHEQKEEVKKQYLIKRDAVVCGIEAYSDMKLKEIAAKIKDWDPFDDSKHSTFFSPTWMFGIDKGFDVVIGNPPYVQLQNNSGKLAILYANEKYKTFARTGDIYTLFYEKGFQLLHHKGILSFITSNKWMRTAYGEKLREYFIQKTNPLKLIDFDAFQVFEATVNTNILISEKASFENKVSICALDKGFSIDNMNEYLRQHSYTGDFSNNSWVVIDKMAKGIKEKVDNVGTILKDWDVQINYGIKTGFNEAFIIDLATKDRLIVASPNSAKIIQPILLGRNLKRYFYQWENMWLINSHNGIKSKGISPIDVEKDYPAIFEYLCQFKEQLEKRNDKGDHWTNLRNCAYIEDFGKPKIAWGNLALEAQFCYVPANFFINAPSPFFSTENLYLLAILNSKLGDYYVKQLGVSRSGGYMEYKPMFIEKLPVYNISKNQQQPFIDKVERILKAKSKSHDTSALERELDVMVYHLYQLTYEEAKIIDPELREEEYEIV